MHLKFLGTGTSQGIPVIGCKCAVCQSDNAKDKRYRSSGIITTDSGKKILIDCGPDFRNQMIDFQEDTVDAILLTHEHNDHVIGLDDVRPIVFRNQKEMPVFANERVCNEVKMRFPYAFAEEKYPGAPSFFLNKIEGNFSVENLEILPIEIFHGKLPILGFRIKNLAYITDASYISDNEMIKLQNLDYLIINSIRKEKTHPSHFILPDIFDLKEKINPKQTYITHISHDFGNHDEENSLLPKDLQLAFDGEEIFF